MGKLHVSESPTILGQAVGHPLHPTLPAASTSRTCLLSKGAGAAKRLRDSNSDQQNNNILQTNLGIVRNFEQGIPTEMIVTSSGISESSAERARASLDAQVAQIQAEGKLEPGKSSHEKLTWTPETIAAAQEFQKGFLAQWPIARTALTDRNRLLTLRLSKTSVSPRSRNISNGGCL